MIVAVAVCLFPPAAQAKSLHFIIDNNIFFKNLEYNNISTIVDGETFTGDLLKPRLRFNINEKLNIEFGAIVRLNFDEESKDSKGFPLISMNYDFSPGWRFTAGTLHRNHPLLDAFFDDTLEFTDPHEQGFQVRARKKHLTMDTWIDWEQIERSTFAEKVNIGNYTQWRNGGFMIDFQAFWNHEGGQKNSAGGVVNNFTIALGTGYTFTPRKRSRADRGFQKAGFSLHVLGAFDKPDPGSNFENNRDEDGLLGKLFATVNDTDFHILIWAGGPDRGIRSRKGDPLYRNQQFAEVGIEKSWQLAENVSLTGSFKFINLRDEWVHVDFLSVKWRGDFPLFTDYFEKLTRQEEAKAREAEIKKSLKKKKQKRRRHKRRR